MTASSPKTSKGQTDKAFRGYRIAQNVLLISAVTSVAIIFGFNLGWWCFLPLLILQAEFAARLFDWGIVGRPVKKPSSRQQFESADGVYTWQEVAEHNTEESAWIAIDGSVYDVTDFVDRHPGGKEMILLSVGREATDLFNSYHPFTELPRTLLAKYRIGSLSSYEHPVYKADGGFYKEARMAVKEYFEENQLDSKEPFMMLLRMFPVYVLFFGCYYVIYVIPGLSLAMKVCLAIFMGMCQGMPLTGWMHDSSHASIGRSERWWWNVGRISLDYISGSSMISWRNQHVLGHHIYTNVMGADPDLPTAIEGDPRRLVEEQVYAKIYKWQHIYLPPLYGILGLKSRLQDFTEIFSQLMNGPIRVNPISVQDNLRMVSAKCTWLFYRVIVPLVFLQGVTIRQLALLFFCTEFTTGYWLAFNFQVSHISEDVDFIFSDHSKRAQGKCPATVEQEWAEAQIRTTVDYAHNDPVSTYLSGALNYQTIHHLFPTVSQYHYPKITPIVMKIAKKYGWKFQVFDGFGSAFKAHIGHLYSMGQEGKRAELKME